MQTPTGYPNLFVLRRCFAIAVAIAVLFVGAGDLRADTSVIKSNVVIVKPQYHHQTRVAFSNLSKQLDKLSSELIRGKPEMREYGKLLQSLSRQYHGLATSPGHGSGWLWFPDSRSAFVVTNKHVAGQAGSVTIEFDNNRHPAIPGNRVVYVDDRNDLALIEVPRRALPRGAVGFEIATGSMTEGVEVWAAGFPGTDTARGNIAAYSLTKGVVSNAEFPGVEGRAIAHTATIDPGNSGGPLLLERRKGSYEVVGMNTWKWRRRSNVNLSIPAPTLSSILRKAIASRTIARNSRQLARSLDARAQQLSIELGSSQPNYALLNSMIAYSFVAERPEIISALLSELLAGRMKKQEIERFLTAPLEVARETLWVGFFKSFSTGRTRVGAVHLDRITDRDKIAVGAKIRSLYKIAGKSQEIVWVWEHGSWKIANASFENVQLSKPAPRTAATRTAQPAPAPRKPTVVKAARKAKRPAHSRWHLGVKGGYLAASEVTIETDATGAIDVASEAGFAIIANLDRFVTPKWTLGGQLFYATATLGDAEGVTVTTFNATAKGHYGSGTLEWRPGVSMGYQKASSVGDDSTGLGVGAFLEIAYATSSRADWLLEAGFISQPMGGGDDFYLTFGPTFYIALGLGYGR